MKCALDVVFCAAIFAVALLVWALSPRPERPTGAQVMEEFTRRGDAVLVARVLTEKNMDPDFLLTRGMTGLLLAAQLNHTDAALLLLERGANPNRTNLAGATPLMYAVQQGNERLAIALLAKGASVQVTNAEGHTLLDFARDSKQPRIHDLITQRAQK